jgi:hypothetical protein
VARADAPPLAELQRRLFALITAPEGVARGLGALGIPRAELEAVIAGDARAGAVERLDVYANMYFFRILEVLREQFPKLAAALGEAPFHDLVTGYLVAHPSANPSLRDVGRALPGFVAGHAEAAARPFLADLAALEWARLDVFDRADAAPVSREALAGLPPEGFAALALTLIPALEIVPARYAVDETWRALPAEAPLEAPVPLAPGAALLVWRRGVTVYHRRLDPAEREGLELARAGGSFGGLCAALGRGRDDGEAAGLAAELLGRWLADELVAAR